jgi:soluble lytic murein transglycosylase-like protein
MLGVSDPFDPSEGVNGGARYLRAQLNRYHGNRALALAAYNAGPGAVRGTVPQNGETEVYVLRVLAQWRTLRDARRPARGRPL